MWFSRRGDKDFQAEIESHIHLEADRLIAEGMPPAEAQDAARRAFGNVALGRERFYESQRWAWRDQIGRDLRFGVRCLRKTPGFTAAAALTIALGTGANTAIFSLVDAVLLRSLPLQNPKELVFLEAAGSAGTSGAPPYPCFGRLREETASFSGMAAFATDELRVEIDGKPEQVMGQAASGNYFDVLGVRPALGRLMTSEDEKLNPLVAVISDRFWRRRFAADPAVIGTLISFGKQAFTIIGVTPPEFWGLQPGTQVDVTLPITLSRDLMADSGARWFHAVGRLGPGVPPARAEAEATRVFQSFMSGSGHPAELIEKHFHHMELRPASHGMDVLRRRFSRPLYLLMGIAAMVLLMAAANIANLLLARGISRQREFALRLAVGAGRTRLIRQLLTETLLLFTLGAVPGVALAGWGVTVIEGLFAEGRRAITIQADLNWRVLIFTMVITLAAALVAGLFPAWRAFRTDPDQAIKQGQARATESRGSAVLTRTLVAFQAALSLVLLAGAVTFARTLINLRSVDPGFRNEHTMTMSVRLPDGYLQAGKSPAIWTGVLQAVREIPGVRAAGLSAYTPLSGRNRGALIRVRGYLPANFEDSSIHINRISDGYFETLGIPLLSGRLPTPGDGEAAVKNALINETAARKYFGGRDPVGEFLEFGRKGTTDKVYRIVGVVRDTKHLNLRDPAPRFAFLPLRERGASEQRVTLTVASAAPNGEMALVPRIRSRLAMVDPGILISDVISMQTQLDSTLLTERLLAGLSGVFGVLALILASVGLYGVVSYGVSQQRKAIGIRMALGASPSSVVMSVLRQSGCVVAAGLVSGLPLAFLTMRTADSMLWGVKSTDAATYIPAAAMLCLAGAASAYLPARRASAIEPAEALRQS